MSDSWINHLPLGVQERVRRRMMSPEAYEKLRDKVKGPKELQKEMEKNEIFAELKFGLETEPALHDALKSQVEADQREQGIEHIFDTEKSSTESKKLVEEGKFTLTVMPHSTTHREGLAAIPEGNIQEALPMKPSQSDEYASQFLNASTGLH